MSSTSPLTLNIHQNKYLALRSKIPESLFDEILTDKDKHIKHFPLSQVKDDGKIKIRDIYNPSPTYKKLLRSLNKNLFKNSIFPEGVVGGVSGKSLNDMVKIHCGKEAIYIIDFKDFYPNITISQIEKLFRSTKCSRDISVLLANLISYNNFLPQGFPTSTIIANLVAYKLDIEHNAICNKFNLSRTRWIDDIVFSGRIKELEKAISSINNAVFINGFSLNPNKSNFIRRKDNPQAVGLCLDKHQPYIHKGIIDKINDTIQIILSFGVDVALSEQNIDSARKLQQSLEGKIKYVANYNKSDADFLKSEYSKINWD